MNLSETLQLLDKLREVGAHRFKFGDMDIDLGPDRPITIHMPPEQHKAAEPTPDPQSVYSPDNTQKAQELIDLLKLKDEELVNRIFPAGA